MIPNDASYLSRMAFRIMNRAIKEAPDSAWARETTEQWLRYCEAERKILEES